MAEAHQTFPEAIREACNVNQFKEREKPGAEVSNAETKQVSGLERRKG